MGADLIGYLVTGPKRLPRGKTYRQALKHAEAIIEQVRAAETEEGYDRKKLPATHRKMDSEDLDNILDLDAEQVLDDLYALWDGMCRDASMRTNPDDPKRVLVFAGELSWGDEPDGTGYLALRDAERLGLLDFFGIR